MLHFSGMLQLAAIVKEDTTKNGDKLVYFTGYSRRGEDSDKVFCKVYGNTAEYLMRNLVKKDDGKYVSRKIYVAGYLETYVQTRTESLPPKLLEPSDLDPQYGMLTQSIKIVFKRETKEEKFLLKVSHLDFEDKKRDLETIEIYRGGDVNIDKNDHKINDVNYNVKCNNNKNLLNALDQANEGLTGLNVPPVLEDLN